MALGYMRNDDHPGSCGCPLVNLWTILRTAVLCLKHGHHDSAVLPTAPPPLPDNIVILAFLPFRQSAYMNQEEKFASDVGTGIERASKQFRAVVATEADTPPDTWSDMSLSESVSTAAEPQPDKDMLAWSEMISRLDPGMQAGAVDPEMASRSEGGEQSRGLLVPH
ncbi:hypothetical protein RhiJN_09480 [Ceratobasidium sp. AG-Ba]|nr:hypothetical protein RhiJN_09480 [Ceratobasidium sp. AG-Ba]